MQKIKKEIVYTMPYLTAEDIKKANNKRQALYNKFNSVQVYPDGLNQVKIIATNSII